MKKIKITDINVFDIEAKNWIEFQCAGVIYKDNYYYFSELSDLYDFIKNNEGIYYAHNGGKYDFLFLLEEMNNRNDKCKLICSNSSIIQLHIGFSELRDSLIILPCGLQKLATTFLSEKKEELIFTKKGLKKRVYKDCDILKRILEKYRDYLKIKLNSEIKLTLASTALFTFRKNFMEKKKFEKQNFAVMNKIYNGYYGGRTEIYRFRGENLYYYDINSMYPYCATMDLPTPFKKPYISSKLKDSYIDKYCLFIDGIFDVQEDYITQLPYRHNKKIYFPFGKISGTYALPDLKISLENNNIKIVKINEVIIYEKSDILKGYMLKLYNIRKKCNDKTEKYILKILLNSLYGKFAQRINKSSIIINPEHKRIIEEKLIILDEIRDIYVKQGKIYTPDFIQPQLSAYITSLARELLYKEMLKIQEHIYYCDTDSIFTDIKIKTSNEIGFFKLEKTIKNANFYLPKLYKLITIEDEEIEKTKGFGKEKGLFDRLIKKETIDYNKGIYTFKTCLRRSFPFLERKKDKKQIKSIYNKRGIIGNDTFPLHIDKILTIKD